MVSCGPLEQKWCTYSGHEHMQQLHEVAKKDKVMNALCGVDVWNMVLGRVHVFCPNKQSDDSNQSFTHL